MKWHNRGHEFDELGAYFKSNRDIYIYSIDDYAHAIADKLSFLNAPVHFISPIIGTAYCFEKIKSLAKWIKNKKLDYVDRKKDSKKLYDVLRHPEKKIIIIPNNYAKYKSVFSLFQKAGFELNKNLFLAEDFLRIYLSVYALYLKDKVYFPDISFIPSTKCNLNCQCCLNFTPYLKKMKDEPIERLKKEIDLFFSHIDYIGLFHISGGEPVLYPHIGELLSYIDDNYSAQIHNIAVTTNGTHIFSDEICCTLRKHNILVICDDYTRTLPKYKKAFKKLITKLRHNNISYTIYRVPSWIDLAPNITNNSHMSNEELINFYNACSIPWSEYYGGKLYSCNYAHYAEKAGLTVCDDTEYIDISTLTKDSKKELIEFRFGYTEKGYVEFCKTCAGFCNNPYRKIPAEQASGR